MKTNELTGVALDWAVAKCEGRKIERDPLGFNDGSYWVWEDKTLEIGKSYSPSTNWAQGGPIIEREHICLMYYPTHWSALAETGQRHSRGTTPLEAAMRCYVASKLGDEVQLPEELA